MLSHAFILHFFAVAHLFFSVFSIFLTVHLLKSFHLFCSQAFLLVDQHVLLVGLHLHQQLLVLLFVQLVHVLFTVVAFSVIFFSVVIFILALELLSLSVH